MKQDADKSITELYALLSNISIDNFKGVVLTGTTSSSANTQAYFKHGLAGTPRCHWRIEGDVYVPVGGHGPKQVDVRSAQTSQPFKILVFL